MAWCRLRGGTMGNSVSARARRIWVSLLATIGRPPRSATTAATISASGLRRSSVMIVTTSPSFTSSRYPPRVRPTARICASVRGSEVMRPNLSRQGREHFGSEALHLAELVEGAEAADEAIYPRRAEPPEPVRHDLRGAGRSPVGQVHGLAELGIVAGDVLAERAGGLLGRVADVHRDLVRDGVPGEILAEIGGRLAQLGYLLGHFLGAHGPAAGHPAVAVLDHPGAGVAHPAFRHLGGQVAGEPDVGDHPGRRRLLDRHQRPHLGAGVKRDVVEVVVLTVVGNPPGRPQRPQHGQALLEHRGPLAERQTERLELAPDAVLRVAHAGAEDRSAAAELVQGGPLQSQVERVPRRGDQARGAEPGPRGPLGDRGQQADRLVPGLGEQAVAHPDRPEAPLLRQFCQVKEVGQGVVGGDQRFPVVQVDTEFHTEPRSSAVRLPVPGGPELS